MGGGSSFSATARNHSPLAVVHVCRGRGSAGSMFNTNAQNDDFIFNEFTVEFDR